MSSPREAMDSLVRHQAKKLGRIMVMQHKIDKLLVEFFEGWKKLLDIRATTNDNRGVKEPDSLTEWRRKGGRALAAKLTPEERSESARRAINARWAKAKKGETSDGATE